jgi:hypothetical protein
MKFTTKQINPSIISSGSDKKEPNKKKITRAPAERSRRVIIS